MSLIDNGVCVLPTSVPNSVPRIDASQHLLADFETAAGSLLRGDVYGADPYTVFCAGVAMCIGTLDAYCKEKNLWPKGATTEAAAVELYLAAAEHAIATAGTVAKRPGGEPTDANT